MTSPARWEDARDGSLSSGNRITYNVSIDVFAVLPDVRDERQSSRFLQWNKDDSHNDCKFWSRCLNIEEKSAGKAVRGLQWRGYFWVITSAERGTNNSFTQVHQTPSEIITYSEQQGHDSTPHTAVRGQGWWLWWALTWNTIVTMSFPMWRLRGSCCLQEECGYTHT